MWAALAGQLITAVGVEILNHCIMTPKTGRDSNNGRIEGSVLLVAARVSGHGGAVFEVTHLPMQ